MALEIDTVSAITSSKVTSTAILVRSTKPMSALLKQIQNSSGQAVTRNALAALNAVMPHNEEYMGVVLIGSRRVYTPGRPGRGSLAAVSPIPCQCDFEWHRSSPVGVVEPGVSPADLEMFYAFVQTDNAGAFTLPIGGEAPRSVQSEAGNPLSPGEWTKIVVFTINPNGDFSLLLTLGRQRPKAQLRPMLKQTGQKRPEIRRSTQQVRYSVILLRRFSGELRILAEDSRLPSSGRVV